MCGIEYCAFLFLSIHFKEAKEIKEKEMNEVIGMKVFNKTCICKTCVEVINVLMCPMVFSIECLSTFLHTVNYLNNESQVKSK